VSDTHKKKRYANRISTASIIASTFDFLVSMSMLQVVTCMTYVLMSETMLMVNNWQMVTVYTRIQLLFIRTLIYAKNRQNILPSAETKHAN